jgi:carboxypeptidase Q
VSEVVELKTVGCCFLGFAIVALTHSQSPQLGDPSVIDRIITEGRDHSHVMAYLMDLTQNIGPRLTGSPRLDKAEQWGLRNFRKIGLTNVHLEKWGEIPVGFDHGPVQIARMVEPFISDMVFTTPAWTNGTNGIERGEVVLAPQSPEEVTKKPTEFKHKWILLSPGASSRSGTTATIAALSEVGALGTITGSRNELVVTGGSYTSKSYEKHPGLPQVTVRKSDFERLTRNIEYHHHPVVEIGADNRWYKGPRPEYNVIGEIKGSEQPDELVIVSGHLDSWNGPGSQGALDNGVGTCTALEAARILTRAKAKPKRTIRFILWTGEEQGLFGSKAYVKDHEAELPKISAVLVDDGGTNYQGGYQGIAMQKEIMEAAFAPTVKAFPQFPQKFVVQAHMAKGGGSDHVPFNGKGVPGFFTIETGRSDYTFVHHTQHDRLEMAIPEYLVQSGTNHAVVAYNLACAPTLLPRDK